MDLAVQLLQNFYRIFHDILNISLPLPTLQNTKDQKIRKILTYLHNSISPLSEQYLVCDIG